jgi:CspA family cold shock protein
MAKGVVVRIERSHGYGFIQMKDGTEAFFHQRWLRGIRFRSIKIGSILEFDLERGYRGPKAINMRLATDEANEQDWQS